MAKTARINPLNVRRAGILSYFFRFDRVISGAKHLPAIWEINGRASGRGVLLVAMSPRRHLRGAEIVAFRKSRETTLVQKLRKNRLRFMSLKSRADLLVI